MTLDYEVSEDIGKVNKPNVIYKRKWLEWKFLQPIAASTTFGQVNDVRDYVIEVLTSMLVGNERLVENSIPDDIGMQLLRQSVLDFNLNQQEEFKRKGHAELYMMDDTPRMKHNEKTLLQDKTYLHTLDGKAIVDTGEKDESGEIVEAEVNSSQMNVLFPYKKVTSKSLYATQLKVMPSTEMDGVLERARDITLQGKVSHETCLQGVAQVGNNMYVMSPNVDLGGSEEPTIYGNGTTIVNSHLKRPWQFPQSMTLFQPSQGRHDDGTAQDFVDWCNCHNRKTIVALDDTYGGNVSRMTVHGVGSYEIALGTYSPTDIVLYGRDIHGVSNETDIPLTTDTYRAVRNGELENHFYQTRTVYVDGVAT